MNLGKIEITCSLVKHHQQSRIVKKNLTEFKQELEEWKTAPMITQAMIGGLRAVHKGATPSVYSCGMGSIDGGITISGIIKDQADIGWINFLCGRFSIQWKEAQKRHYLRIGTKKSPGNCHTEEITYDTMGYVAIPEHSTSLTDWPNVYGQSLLIKHSNK